MKNNSMMKYLRFGAGSLFLFALLSCTKVEYPKPTETPINLTAEAQTTETKVKNLSAIGPENPETDIVEWGNLETTKNWQRINNDWISLYIGGELPREVIRITVTENTSTEPRIYKLEVNSKTRSSTLTIIQAGKS